MEDSSVPHDIGWDRLTGATGATSKLAQSQQVYAEGSWELIPAVGPESLFLFPRASPRRLGLRITWQLGDKSRKPTWKPLGPSIKF